MLNSYALHCVLRQVLEGDCRLGKQVGGELLTHSPGQGVGWASLGAATEQAKRFEVKNVALGHAVHPLLYIEC